MKSCKAGTAKPYLTGCHPRAIIFCHPDTVILPYGAGRLSPVFVILRHGRLANTDFFTSSFIIPCLPCVIFFFFYYTGVGYWIVIFHFFLSILFILSILSMQICNIRLPREILQSRISEAVFNGVSSACYYFLPQRHKDTKLYFLSVTIRSIQVIRILFFATKSQSFIFSCQSCLSCQFYL